MTNIILRRRKLGKGSINNIRDKMQENIVVLRNWRASDIPEETHDEGYVFRWGCTSSLPFEFQDHHVVNTAKSIHWCSDKRQGRLDMQGARVPVPETWAASNFLPRFRDHDDRFVLRRASHSRGRDLWHGTGPHIHRCINTQGVEDGYVSRLIEKVAEYRVFICQNRAVWVAKKTPGNPEDIAWNVANGGRFDNVRWGDWSLGVVIAALQAAVISGTDFCGVDVMVDAEGNPYVLEVNSAPSQTSPYRQQCVAKCFDYIIRFGKKHFEALSEVSSWKDLIHPIIWSI